MKRLAFQTKTYNYSTKEEAMAHMEEMRAKGWSMLEQDVEEDGYTSIYIVETDEWKTPYMVEYCK